MVAYCPSYCHVREQRTMKCDMIVMNSQVIAVVVQQFDGACRDAAYNSTRAQNI